MQTKLNIIPLSNRDITEKIDKSVNGTILAVIPVDYIKEVTLDSIKDGLKVERLVTLVEVCENMNGDYIWRPNRNTFRSHEFEKNEEHPWRLEPRKEFVAYTLDDSIDYFKNLILLSLGYTYDLDENKWNKPDYTWEFKQ